MIDRTATYLSPPQVAKLLGVKPAKVLAWIKRGELRAHNVADSRSGRPRWRVSREALDAFLAARSCRPSDQVARPRRKRRPTELIEFF